MSHTHLTVPTRFIEVDGDTFAYRPWGNRSSGRRRTGDPGTGAIAGRSAWRGPEDGAQGAGSRAQSGADGGGLLVSVLRSFEVSGRVTR
ncbi:hypothetical protein D3C71_1759410 [compost metagenome]